MACGAPREGDMGDDGGDFLAAAQRDDILAAKLLIRLSRPESPVLPPTGPPRRLLELLPGPRWRRKGWRSRAITMEGIRAAEREEATTRASPTTPLSWSGGGSGTSGSVCGGRKPQRRKRRRGHENGDSKEGVPEKTAGGKWIRAPPAKSRKPEPFQYGRPSPAPAPVALGSSTSSGTNKVLAAAAAVRDPASSSPVARVAPLRFRLTGEVTGPVVVGHPAKKKTVAELQAVRESLLQEQEGLRKEVEGQRVLYNALFEENMRLKMLESTLSSHIESRPTSTHVVCEEAKLEQPQHVQSIPESQTVEGPCTASSAPEQKEERPGESLCTAPGRMFLFDLNCIPDDGLEKDIYCT